MNESLLSSSGESLDLSNVTENSQTYLSYSLFDKNKHNFSTSSEISLIKSNLSPQDQNQTVRDEICKDEEEKFNPFLLLFVPDNDVSSLLAKQTQHFHDEIENYPPMIDLEKTECANEEKEEKHLSKRNSLKNQRKNSSTDEDDQAFQRFLQEHRTTKDIEEEKKTSTERPKRKNRNSLKKFICDSSSSSSAEDPTGFYAKVNRIIDKDPLWTKSKSNEYESDDDYASDESSQSSSSSSLSSENDYRPKSTKKKLEVTFLESLSNYVPIDDKHPETKQYFLKTGFKNKNKRQQLADQLFSMFDRDVFSCELSPKASVTWSARLTSTAGHCTTRRSSQTAIITLSQKVCDTPERCRDTLLHEMCHAAVSLIDGVMNEGHGPLWKKWTKKAERTYPYLPPISVKHTYEINYKFIYRCVQCQYEVHRHSKSLNVEIDLCGKCLGKFELLLNNKTTSTGAAADVQTPKKTLTKYNLFIKEHFQRIKQEQPHLSTPQLMKHLGQEYKKTTQQSIPIDLPDLEQLKI